MLAGILLALAALSGTWRWLGWHGGPTYTALSTTGRSATAPAVVLLSGDMGFKVGMGRRIADRLAADGVPVTGVNSLAFFSRRRTPAEVSAMLAEAIGRAVATSGRDRVVLIGQSFGADMMHVGLADLPPDMRRHVALVVLVVPSTTLNFTASPAEMLELTGNDGPALPSARRLDWVPVLCIHGRDERESLCPLLGGANVRSVALPGGHPLRRDADALYAAIAPAIETAR